MKNFKTEVLDILGLKIDLQKKPDPSWTDNGKIIPPGKGSSNPQIQDYVNKIIDAKIRNVVGNTEDKEKEFKKINDSLKSFTLDDILHHVKGFSIGKGFYQAKEENVSKHGKEGREAELLNYKNKKDGWYKYEGKCGTIGDFYSVRIKHTIDEADSKKLLKTKKLNSDKTLSKETEQISHIATKNYEKFSVKPGDIILALKVNNDGYFFGDKGPAQILEKGIQKIYGGKLNSGHSDAVKDLESGVEISVKCWANKNSDYGSLDAIANHNREVKLLIYNYDTYNTNIKLGGKNYIGFIICRKNEKQSGTIKKGKLKTSEGEKIIAQKNNLNFNKSVNILKTKIEPFLLNKSQNEKYKSNVINFILKIRNSLTKMQFNKMDALGKYYDDTLRKEIKKFLENNKVDKSGTDKLINDIIDNKFSVETNYFNY